MFSHSGQKVSSFSPSMGNGGEVLFPFYLPAPPLYHFSRPLLPFYRAPDFTPACTCCPHYLHHHTTLDRRI